MAEGTIDNLSIEVSSNAAAAASGINTLASALSSLDSSVGASAAKLSELAKSLSSLKTSLSGVSFTALSSGLKQLEGTKVSGTIGDNIAKISTALAQLPQDAGARLSGLGALSQLDGLKASASIPNNLQKIADAVRSFPEDAGSRLGSVAAAIEPLRAFNGVDLKSAFGQLQKLPAVLKEFADLDTSGLAQKMRELNSALKPLAGSVGQLAAAYGSMPTSMRSAAVAARSVQTANKNLADTNNKLSTSNKNVSATLGNVELSLSGLRAAMAKLTAAWYAIKKTASAAITEVNTYIENMNLFEASMGKFTQSATAFGNKVQDLMGIDFGEWARNQGVFMTLATGMGVAADKASVMSQQLTQLGYDISSFYNISVNDAMTKLQSGLAGELEPLRRIGWDLSVARMNLELTKMGIEGNANSMTQAEKVALRYKLIMEQVTQTHGDMARTIASPANQTRVLQAQVTLAARALGNLFIPMLNKLLPVAIGAAKAVRILAETIASLFGLDIKFEVDYSGLDASGIVTGNDAVEDTADALEDAADAADTATKKVKAYQNTVMGFDELNKLNATPEDTGNAGSGSGDSGTGDVGGIGLDDLDLPTYDFLKELDNSITRLSDEIAKKMVNALKEILPWATAIGTAIAGWKIAPKLASGLSKLSTALGNAALQAKLLAMELREAGKVRLANAYSGVGKALAKLGTATAGMSAFFSNPKMFAPWLAALALVVGHFTYLTTHSENFRRGLGKIKEALEKLPPLSEVLQSAFDKLREIAGKIADKVAGWFDGLAVPPALQAIVDKFYEARDAVAGFLSQIGALDALGAVGKLIETTLGYALDALELGFSDAAMGVGVLVAALTGNFPLALILAGIEAVSLAIRGIGWATSPCIEEVEALAGVSEETAERFGTSLDSMSDAMYEIDRLDFGNMVVTEADVENIGAKITDIHDTILNNLDSKRNEELANLESLRGFLTDKEVDEAKRRANEFWDGEKAKVDEGTARITEIMANASSENRALSRDESAEINRILQDQYDRLVATSGASSEEIASINEAMHNNNKAAALEAASEVIKSAIDEKEKSIAAAEEKYDNIVEQAKRMKDAGQISDDEYRRMVAAAEAAKKSEINEAEAKYDGILQKTQEGLGDELLPYIDAETGEIRTKWDVAFADIKKKAGDAWERVKDAWHGAGRWFDEKVAQPIKGFFKEKWDAIKGLFANAKTDVQQTWRNLPTWFSNNVITPLKNFWSPIKGFFSNLFSSISQHAQTIWHGIGNFVSGVWTSIRTAWQNAGNWFSGSVLTPIRNVFSTAWSSISNIVSNVWQGVKNIWNSAGNWFSSSVLVPIKNAFSSAWSTLQNGASNAWQGIKNVFSTVANFFGNVFGNAWQQVRNVFSLAGNMFQNFSNAITSAFKNIANNIIGGINNAVNVPFGTLSNMIESMRNWEVFGSRIFSWLPRLSIPRIPYLAEGRYGIEAGQLFVAREKGAELVGQMGSHTTVANNQQIVEGIEAGVMSAMLRVLPSFQTSQDAGDVTLVLQVGNEQLAKATNKGNASLARRGQLKPEIQFV